MLAELVQALEAPLAWEEVGYKPEAFNKDRTKALLTYYFDAHAARKRLDEVFPLAWWDQYEELELSEARLVVRCRLTVRLPDGGTVTREGVGESDNSDREPSRWKAANSDAFKRAAMKFGVGHHLQRMPDVWVEAEAQGDKGRLTANGHRQARENYLKFLAGINRLAQTAAQLVEPVAQPQATSPTNSVEITPGALISEGQRRNLAQKFPRGTPDAVRYAVYGALLDARGPMRGEEIPAERFEELRKALSIFLVWVRMEKITLDSPDAAANAVRNWQAWQQRGAPAFEALGK